MSYMVLSKKMV